VTVAAIDCAEDAVGADPTHVHDAARRGRHRELWSRVCSINGLSEPRVPGRHRGVRGIEIRRVEIDKIDAPARARGDPWEVIRSTFVAGDNGFAPRDSFVN